MNRRNLLKNLTKAVLLGAFATSAVLPLTSQAAPDPAAKVVYHVDFKDPTRYSATLTSINNIINYYESEFMEADVHLVFVGFGLRFTTDDPLKGTPYEADQALLTRQAELKGRLDALIKTRDVKVHLCDKTREEVNLPQNAVYPSIQFTASGVAKIAILQSQGYAYLKVQ